MLINFVNATNDANQAAAYCLIVYKIPTCVLLLSCDEFDHAT